MIHGAADARTVQAFRALTALPGCLARAGITASALGRSEEGQNKAVAEGAKTLLAPCCIFGAMSAHGFCLPGADTFGRQYRFTPKAALLREYTREVVSFCQTGTRSHATEAVLLGCRSEGMRPSTRYEARASRRLWKHGGWPSWVKF